VIVVDSSALIAILRKPEADDFLHTIAAADGCLLSSVTWLETSMVLAGRADVPAYNF